MLNGREVDQGRGIRLRKKFVRRVKVRTFLCMNLLIFTYVIEHSELGMSCNFQLYRLSFNVKTAHAIYPRGK